MKDESRKILLAHGGGGQLSDELIRGTVLSRLKEWGPEGLEDSARLELATKSILFTTDSYVVKPLFFRGGDIGKLAVCGTVNDLAVCGARPVALSLSLIIEAGLEMDILERILDSVKAAAEENSVRIVTGDIKTVEAGAADKIFINTAGVGVKMKEAKLGFGRIRAGNKVVVSGTIGEHGMTIISQREDIKFETEFESDCAGLGGLICGLVEEFGDSIRFMRDPTRGGLAATLNEISRATQRGVEILEEAIGVRQSVRAAADMLGFDVLNIANEGKFVAIVEPKAAEAFVRRCRGEKLGRDAGVIGQILDVKDVPIVEMVTRIGGRRIVQMPYGSELPRIC